MTVYQAVRGTRRDLKEQKSTMDDLGAVCDEWRHCSVLMGLNDRLYKVVGGLKEWRSGMKSQWKEQAAGETIYFLPRLPSLEGSRSES